MSIISFRENENNRWYINNNGNNNGNNNIIIWTFWTLKHLL